MLEMVSVYSWGLCRFFVLPRFCNTLRHVEKEEDDGMEISNGQGSGEFSHAEGALLILS